MPRLLLLCEFPTLLGGERSMLSTLPIVAAAGFEIFVAAPAAGPLADELRTCGIKHIEWHTHDAAAERLWLGDLRASLADVFHRVQPALIHANSLSTARISGPVAHEIGTRSIGHLRDIVNISAQAVKDLNEHTRLIAVSHATRDYHVARGLDADKCEVLNNGVDLIRFQPGAQSGNLRRELNLPPESHLIAVVGQLGLRKGTDVALAAAAQIARHATDVHWLIIGERTSSKTESRDFERRLHEFASEPPLAGKVHFLGYRHDLATLLPQCTLLVHAARQEPLGRVLLESAACGLTVVATNAGGTPEIFPTPNDGAILIQVDDADAIAQAVLALVASPERRQSLSTTARRRAEAAFDIRDAARRLVEFYVRVIVG